MPTRAGPDEATRKRLLSVAIRLFSARGFRRVTVRDICRKAGANVSAVNYHFGDKLGLYREVMTSAISRVREDPTTHITEGATAEERLRQYVASFVPHMAAPKGPDVWVMKLMRHEMEEPTPLASWIAEQVILPRVRFLSKAIAELIGCTPEDPRVRRCAISLQAQCVFYMPNNFRKVVFPDWHEPSVAEIDAAVAHITEFTLAGIRAIAKR